jgi:hypothetical protein
LIVTAWVVRAGGGDVAAARRDIAAWLGMPSASDDFAPRPDWAGERALLARASFVSESETAVRVSTTWQRAELDQAARSLASWLESRFAPGGPPAR